MVYKVNQKTLNYRGTEIETQEIVSIILIQWGRETILYPHFNVVSHQCVPDNLLYVSKIFLNT